MIIIGAILVLAVLVILFTLRLISNHAAADKELVFFKEKRTRAVTKRFFWMLLCGSTCRTSSTTAFCCEAG